MQGKFKPIKNGYLIEAEGDTAFFQDISAAIEYADNNGIILNENTEEIFAYRLGGLAVILSETPEMMRDKIIEAMNETTDMMWRDAALDLAKLLTEWANQGNQ